MSTATGNHHGRDRTIRGAIARRPVISYLLMAYALGWSAMIAADAAGLPMVLASSVGAIIGLALPAVIVIAALRGKAGVRDLVGRSVRWRVGIGWYLLAFPGLLAATLLIGTLIGGPSAVVAFVEEWSLFFTVFLPALLVPLVLTHLAEEAGWTGFVQDELQAQHGAMRASLLVAPAFALFHFPLAFLEAPAITGEVVAMALVQVVVLTVIAIPFRIAITWVYNGACRSVLIAALFHSAFNSAGAGSSYATAFIRELMDPSVALLGGVAAVALVALVASVATRRRLGYVSADGSRMEPDAREAQLRTA